MDDAPIIYGLEDFQARALAAQTAETEKINFFVGTQSLNSTNQVQLIEYDDDSGLVSKKSYDHSAGEIWKLSCAPHSPDILSTIYNTNDRQVTECSCAVWRLPQISKANSNGLDETRDNVELLADLSLPNEENKPGDGVRWVGWSPESDCKMATLSHTSLVLWDLNTGKDTENIKVSSVGNLGGVGGNRSLGGAGSWYPHQQGNILAATQGGNVSAYDTRTMGSVWTISNAHGNVVKDLDFNPNLQYNVATCGDDCNVKFWDIRRSGKPLLSLKHHSHWVWSVRYNASYDQLILSCSSDQRVVLSNVPSVAAMPFGGKEEVESGADPSCIPEGVIQTYDEHEDSVYSVEWSAGDFWTFASLSYDGRLVINKVPRAVKYRQFL